MRLRASSRIKDLTHAFLGPVRRVLIASFERVGISLQRSVKLNGAPLLRTTHSARTRSSARLQ